MDLRQPRPQPPCRGEYGGQCPKRSGVPPLGRLARRLLQPDGPAWPQRAIRGSSRSRRALASARALLLAGREVPAEEALALGLATAVVAAPEAAIAAAATAATRLGPETVALLHARTRAADDAADLDALVRSAARPGLKARIEAYRAQVAARR